MLSAPQYLTFGSEGMPSFSTAGRFRSTARPRHTMVQRPGFLRPAPQGVSPAQKYRMEPRPRPINKKKVFAPLPASCGPHEMPIEFEGRTECVPDERGFFDTEGETMNGLSAPQNVDIDNLFNTRPRQMGRNPWNVFVGERQKIRRQFNNEIRAGVPYEQAAAAANAAEMNAYQTIVGGPGPMPRRPLSASRPLSGFAAVTRVINRPARSPAIPKPPKPPLVQPVDTTSSVETRNKILKVVGAIGIGAVVIYVASRVWR